jgi:hypothetical protein
MSVFDIAFNSHLPEKQLVQTSPGLASKIVNDGDD